MKIVVDTNVVISGAFFGGAPRQVITAITGGKIKAYATTDIVDEYNEIVAEMIDRKQGHLNKDILMPFIVNLNLIEPITQTDVCRDPDDNKFLSCAVDAKALFIVSGDKDLLDLKTYENVQIITAREFCDTYLNVKTIG